ncbi:MAG: ATP-binding cassette domain-containing protein, partial [Bacillota bacterium]|nr:ATP-binding cassette domain-containing protein [Bacillota bacterium]
MAILEVKKLTLRFGGLTAVSNLSFDIKENSIMSLIGPNGAGKTSAFNCLTGFYKGSEG